MLVRSARFLVKATAAAADVVRRPPTGLVVLIYHRVGRRTSVEVDLPLDLFEQQMRCLAEECRVVTLDEGLRMTTAERPDSQTVVAVTFDDGTADFADIALPVIARFSVPVTLYAATGFIDEGGEFPDGGTPVSWGALRDARSTGLVEIGSHTHRHALLDRLPASQVAEELDRSIDLIATNLGVPPQHFAYPKAVLGSATAEQGVRARFRSAALAGTRPNCFGDTDVHRLSRSPIQLSDGMRWFARKVQGGMAMEDSFRRRLNSRRHRHLDA
jgi:peptidoglycan/xylan/chitin deacetylase (PgdA/CDA1 family)